MDFSCRHLSRGDGISLLWGAAQRTYRCADEGGECMSGMHRDRMTPPSQNKRRSRIRTTIQLLSALFLNGYAVGFAKGKIFTGNSKSVCVPVLNCYSCPGAVGSCPIGAMQNAIGARHQIPFYVLGSVMLFGLILGRLICGFLCPFGFLQDLLYKIPLKKPAVPERLDRVGRKGKYAVLLLMVILLPAFARGSTGIAPPFFCKYFCPAGTLEAGIPLVLTNPALRSLTGLLFHWKVIVLIVIVAGSIFISRFFCRYFCPLGALYSLFNRFSFYQMNIDREKCVGCGTCRSVCPMDVDVVKDPNNGECIRCGKCRATCPTNALDGGFRWKVSETEIASKY